MQRHQLGVLCVLLQRILLEDIMHSYTGYQVIKSLCIKIAYAFVVLLVLEGCQGCNQAAVAPNEYETISKLGGIPNLGNTCYMNSVLQIIAKLYPDIFEGKDDALAKAGQVIVDKIKDDQDYVTEEDAEVFYTALLNEAQGKLTRGRQESADECMDIIWEHFGFPNVDDTLGTPYMTLRLRCSNDNGARLMSQLLNDYAKEMLIKPENFLNGVVPIKLNRSEANGPTTIKINTVVKRALQLTITKTHIPSLSNDLNCQLAGFIVHSGPATGGHYFAYINRSGQWRLYNDDQVQKVAISQAEQAAEQAYLFFYEINA